jgi:hypothetical protein
LHWSHATPRGPTLKPWRSPTANDINNAKVRHSRHAERDRMRLKGTYKVLSLTLQPVPPAEDTGSLTPSSAAPAPASSHLEFLSGGSSAGGCLLSTSPFAHSLTPAPAPPSLCIGVAGPSLGSNSDVGPAGIGHVNPVSFGSLVLPRHT